MLFLFASIFFLIAPGVLLSFALNWHSRHVLFYPVLSWAYLILLALVSRIFSVSQTLFIVFIHLGLLILTVICIAKFRKGVIHFPKFRPDLILTSAILVILYSLYHVFYGVYLEIPADIYSHLGKLHLELDSIYKNQAFSTLEFEDVFKKSAHHWYTVYAFLTVYVGARAEDTFPYIVFINSTLLILGVFHFCLYIFRNTKEQRIVKIGIAITASVIFFSYFGVNIFSYIRYYALAPTVTGYLVFLASIVVFLEAYHRRLNLAKSFISFAVLTLIAGLIHLQEMVYIIAMIWIMSAVILVQNNRNPRLAGEGKYFSNLTGSWATLSGWLPAIFFFGLLLVSLVWIFSYIYLNRNPPSRPWVIPLSDYLPFIRHLYILNPTFQFYHVLAFWGYCIYILFFLNIRDFKGNAYILAGMTIPLVTVLNPVFVDLYLRYQESFTLYRFLYMVPITFVGAYLLVKYSRIAIFETKIGNRVLSCIVVFVLLIGLFPFDASYLHNSNSRISTLGATEITNHPSYWSDLVSALEKIDSSSIITDPVTGYVINAITKHKVKTRKYRKGLFINLRDDYYETEEFKPYEGNLMIINRRKGYPSETGRVSGHWRENIMDTGILYSTEFYAFVESNPVPFNPIWRNDGISLYRIQF